MAEGPAWRDDFPIAWTEDDLVTRRELTKTLVWVSCASFAASTFLTARAATRSVSPVRVLKVADVDDLPVGGSRVFDYPAAGEPCLLVRRDAHTFVAYSQKCTHLGCPVVYQAEEGRLHCPCHEGFFDVADGRVLAGPPPRPLPRIALERRGQELWAVGWEP
jgi:nitrite reductase/ring-hydroxylating ferredoxin subunit